MIVSDVGIHRSPNKMEKVDGEKFTVDLDELQMSPVRSWGSDDLEGEMAQITNSQNSMQQTGLDQDKNFDTLDEPVLHTVKRDLTAVALKFRHVLFPKNNQTLLRDWDLWGPLFICVTIALILQDSSSDIADQTLGHGPQFTEVFVLTFFGSCVVTLNIKLLGGKISFFQSLCVMGYCLLPLCIGALICRLFVAIDSGGHLWVFLIRFIIATVALGWSVYASTAFLAGCLAVNRKLLSVYPMVLFYFVVAWMVLSHNH